MLWKQILLLPEVKNIFVSRTQILRPQQVFPSLTTMKTMLIGFQCRSLIKSVSQQRAYMTIKMADRKEIGERNWKGTGKMKKSKC